ncbi:transcription termination factor MTERF8, chloroplastic-like [Curcuma longa]|uniref:transcription termination factor MTERF8, chloroplastic-like n=1 Tax=Curcuma longa TaxID=136217 RepID=UPI003D9F5EF0
MNFLLDECGIPEDQVSRILRRHPCFFVQKPDSLRALVGRAEGIGITRGSGMFVWILDVLHKVSRQKFETQVKIMTSFGLSNSDFATAIKKHPTFLWLSTDVLQRKMEFLIKDVGVTPSDIANKSVFLALSLEKRLIPRYRVMEMLKSEGLWTSQGKLRIFFKSPRPVFLQKFVLPHKDKLPQLLEAF